MYAEELNNVQMELSLKQVHLFPLHPQYAGAAYWAQGLRQKIERPLKLLKAAKWLPHTGIGDEVHAQYQQLVHALDEFICKTFNDWCATIDEDPMKKLQAPLMCRNIHEPGMIDANFDRSILKHYQEMIHWEQLMFEIPQYVQELYFRKDELQTLLQNVLVVVREYNQIMSVLSPEEKGLFRQKIRFLDKRIQPGLTTLTWVSSNVVHYYIADCRHHCQKVQKLVSRYKKTNSTITQLCDKLSGFLLVSTNNKRIYENEEFEEEQKKHQEIIVSEIGAIHKEILTNMSCMFEYFKTDGPEVYSYWFKYTKQVDDLLEEALRFSIKGTLQTLSQAVNGDSKSDPSPLMKVMMTLQNIKIEFFPNIKSLNKQIVITAQRVLDSVKGLDRLIDAFTEKPSQKESVYEVVGKDSDVIKLRNSIKHGLKENAEEMMQYLRSWDKFRHMWEIDKDLFIERYQQLKLSVTSFDSDIARYTEFSNNIQMEETVVPVKFVLLDNSPLKFAIQGHCVTWQQKLTSLLHSLALSKLKDLHSFMSTNSERLQKVPDTLQDLRFSIALYEQLKQEMEIKHAEFEPLNQQFVILNKYEVSVEPKFQKMLEELDEKWNSFEGSMKQAEEMLKKNKERFKAGLLQSAEDFKQQSAYLMSEFNEKGPLNISVNSQDALFDISNFQQQVIQMREKESDIKEGLQLFKLEIPSSRILENLEKDLNHLEQIWKLTQDWENQWNQWRTTYFQDLILENMESTSQELLKKLDKFIKDPKASQWEVVGFMKNKLEQFQLSLPVVKHLRNTALRTRNWDQIRKVLQEDFDPKSSDFTMEYIIQIGVEKYADQIEAISVTATKELEIENNIEQIKATWEVVTLNMVHYKDHGHFRLFGVDNIFQTIEDNLLLLSGMKASRYFKAFEKDIDKWEKSLSLVQEVLEVILNVQRHWMYLENIFLGEDIRKQLPEESAQFDEVNRKWQWLTSMLHKENNALMATHYPDLLSFLNNTSQKLEEIQHSLDMYLETKRQLFPRFYFLSNDDLLEILGQFKDPQAIQPHLKKCFDNIKSLKLGKAALTQQPEALGMKSSDGEYVDFINPLPLEGSVEAWLLEVEKTMRKTLHQTLQNCRQSLRKHMAGASNIASEGKTDKWIREWPGQLCIAASQIQWTGDCSRALQQAKERGKKPLKSLRRKQVAVLEKLSEMVRSNLSSLMLQKVMALVTIEVHARDIIDSMLKMGCFDLTDFNWVSQLRFYWDKDLEDCLICQTNAKFLYGYEYLGNPQRLVITPLTDRCYMTLTTALNLHCGGSPKGPAGTGKTETVKELGKTLGNYVIVINCSEGLDYKSMGRMFAGLAQTGAWGCFDEFNRINIEVLSVVAQQILSLLSALAAKVKRFMFEGQEINLLKTCGIFITMNPGYAGRTELPENLKSMFRPIAMVVPDSAMIAEIFLFAEGFSNTKLLAKKVVTLYSLATQQLSKQYHYDFGLRGLVSVLRHAGKRRRSYPNSTDEEVLILAIQDMNIPKLTSEDIPLFNGITCDLFPSIEPCTVSYGKLKEAIERVMKQAKLQVIQSSVMKVLQFYETKNSRHAVILIGESCSGKTVLWRTLQAAFNTLKKDGELAFNIVKEFPMNPKALSLGELFGEFDAKSGEWMDGVLSSVIRMTCVDEKLDEKWIIFDGPVDTLWIESMNSVMDDNKVLTLINGERIGLSDQVSMLFEVEDLAAASPATVSRCGMVYLDYARLGWQTYVESWLQLKDPSMANELRHLFNKYVPLFTEFKRRNCVELVLVTEICGIMSLCKLLDCLLLKNKTFQSSSNQFSATLKLLFLFCLLWTVCGTVDEEGRKKIDSCMREVEGSFPNQDTVYEYYVDIQHSTWVLWQDRLKDQWKYNPNVPFYKMVVPTVDTVRYQFLIRNLIHNGHPVLIVGPVGTGKSLVAGCVLSELDNSSFSVLNINMSAQTSSHNVQEIIESKLEKRTKETYIPIGGKKLMTFMDDLNLPHKDVFGSQPPLELIRMWLDYRFWYDRRKQTVKYIQNMFLLAAMGSPGGGRNTISQRLQSHFNLISMSFPQDAEIHRIFGSMISQKFINFEEDVKPLAEFMVEATLDVYKAVCSHLLPTPGKIHYLFYLRDISKVFQGLLLAHKDFHDTRQSVTRLWIHECFRVFSDRLSNNQDQEWFMSLISEKLGTIFEQTYHNICPNKQLPIFGSFMNEQGIYEDFQNFQTLKNHLEVKVEEYNLMPRVVTMNLVLFQDAIHHICRIIRVIRQPRGSMLLIGIGGSGRQSLTRLAAYICNYSVFQVEVSRNYGIAEFREDLKNLYWQTGIQKKPTVFLFTDSQVTHEGFLEDINNILSSGEVPNLFKQEEVDEVVSSLKNSDLSGKVSEDKQVLFVQFLDQVKDNLHVVFCISPVGEPYRKRLLNYPALVSCTTIDWFGEWPEEASVEVALKLLDQVHLGESQKEMQVAVAKVFSQMKKSVMFMSERMMLEMKRQTYITPKNYLEMVFSYKRLLAQKRTDLGGVIHKLRSGLHKINETREKVELMSRELQDAQVQVAKFQKECDEYLVIIVQQKREADEQQKIVSARSEKIAEEEATCKKMAEHALQDLNQALPALEEAMKALESLNKKDIGEIKSYGRPPTLVEKVMEAVMILRGSEPTWVEAKRQLGDPNFINHLMTFDKDNINDRVLNRIGKYVVQPDFHPEIVGKVSLAARSLCMWVRAMEVYGKIYRIVEPKRQRLSTAESQLAEKQAVLAEAKNKLLELNDKIETLKNQYEEKLAHKEELRNKAEMLEIKLDRADKLVNGLASEKVRWEENVMDLDEKLSYLVGDCLVAAGFLSFLGPFLSQYRDELIHQWLKQLIALGIPCSPNFNPSSFLASPTTLWEWNLGGLPFDSFSTENGIIVTQAHCCSLVVDPQGQAVKWIRNMEEKRELKVINQQQPDFLRVLEQAIRFGNPVLLENINEELDPALFPILTQSLIQQGGIYMIRLGDKEIEYNMEFCLYIATKLSNPVYTPDIFSKTSVVNFALKEQGLEAQLLGIVVRKERPDLEEQKVKLTTEIAAGRKKLVELEDDILKLLNEAQGSLLDDEVLVNTLHNSKATAEQVAEHLTVSMKTEARIDNAREVYRSCAKRASILFFVMNDMGQIDPMYQFSLGSYIDLFISSIEKSQRSPHLEDRIEKLNDYHTYAVYKFTCRALFERHKLLFAFHMCAKLLEASGKLNLEEYNFFLRGGIVLNHQEQMDNPSPHWLTELAWDNITELDKLPTFVGIANSFEQYPQDWYQWYINPYPENCSLPAEWENTCGELQKMLIVRCLRPDRVTNCVKTFLINSLGSRFVEPPVLDMLAVLEDSTAKTPLMFILSPGVDPSGSLHHLAKTQGMDQRFSSLSLGQGQSPVATQLIKEGIKEGKWIFLANCHLSLSWMPHLERIIEHLQSEPIHQDFRLWLSSAPHPDFPVSILQQAIKMTTEPLKGLKANLKRLYSLITESQASQCQQKEKYQKLLFCLSFFHSILLERHKFQQLGWNVMYSFTDSDFEMSESILRLYLDEYEETPWDALKYLIAGITYGGHTTDEWDRRLLFTYINKYFCDDAIKVPFYKLSVLPTFYVPKDGTLHSHIEYINMLPSSDLPEAFGQHQNADIASQVQNASLLFDILLSLQPQRSSMQTEGKEQKVLKLISDILTKIPDYIDYEGAVTIVAADKSPLNIVLLQEIQRYNWLIRNIRNSLNDLKAAIKGLQLMSSELEEIFSSLYDARVPSVWLKAYPSLKSLGSWTRDLVMRVDQMAQWGLIGRPPVKFWLAGFTFPTGLLTAVLQSAARAKNMPIDGLSWEFIVSNREEGHITEHPEVGIYVRGIYLEGANWDCKASCLIEPEHMKLVNQMPVIHFKPVESKRKTQKGTYLCPCFYYPNRSGDGNRPSFVVAVELRCGAEPAEHWITRGTALLLSLTT
ncbi:dynein heavy chain 2, axonemal-like [Limulus polyphemus]|uniref:Dynein heavy chain 2, axonemal-like n=1 Tax=Limulus polyphemus TaxID=6850 RepID=A0ABM1RWR5_LIMPO|nr:dynein heavy chain 2, axonemal-like [Limulus polyphemus]